METPLYKVLFSGDLEEGHTPEVVKRRCAELFKKQPAQIESLFAGKPVTIKSGLTRQQAENFVRALRDIGARAFNSSYINCFFCGNNFWNFIANILLN